VASGRLDDADRKDVPDRDERRKGDHERRQVELPAYGVWSIMGLGDSRGTDVAGPT